MTNLDMDPGDSASYIPPGLREPAFTILVVNLTSVSLILVCTRYYVRVFLLRSFGWDDFLIGLALVNLSLTPNSVYASH